MTENRYARMPRFRRGLRCLDCGVLVADTDVHDKWHSPGFLNWDVKAAGPIVDAATLPAMPVKSIGKFR